MSIDRNYYVIAGYDLTGMETDKFDDWKWSTEGEDYVCYQSKGKIQFFYDQMSEEHLYFGYILAECSMYENDYVFKLNMSDITNISSIIHEEVKKEFVNVQEMGVIKKDFIPEYQIISFVECS